jgi:cytochrome P450
MASHYGPIFKLNIMGDTHVIISTQKIAEDLMARRGAIYSDRGHLNMVHLVTGSGDLLASSSEGDYWRRGRRFSAAMLTPAKAAQWEPFQEQAAKRMVIDMVKSPSQYVYWFDRYATTVSLREGYGKIPTTEEEEALHTNKIAERMHNIERIATPGGYLVELIPAMMYIPEFLAPFKQEAKALHLTESTYFRQLVQEARLKYEQAVEETPASFVRCFFSEQEKWELSEPEVTYVLGTLYGGGSGTTANAMQSFILAMCHYPDWQTKLQKELDEVVGSSRVPGFKDIPRLPLVRAVAKEVLRWRPVVPGSRLNSLRSLSKLRGVWNN